MAIELIGKIKQKNDGTFALVDSQDIDHEGKRLNVVLQELESGGTAVTASLSALRQTKERSPRFRAKSPRRSKLTTLRLLVRRPTRLRRSTPRSLLPSRL